MVFPLHLQLKQLQLPAYPLVFCTCGEACESPEGDLQHLVVDMPAARRVSEPIVVAVNCGFF